MAENASEDLPPSEASTGIGNKTPTSGAKQPRSTSSPIVCFVCHQPGHRKVDCPHRQQKKLPPEFEPRSGRNPTPSKGNAKYNRPHTPTNPAYHSSRRSPPSNQSSPNRYTESRNVPHAPPPNDVKTSGDTHANFTPDLSTLRSQVLTAIKQNKATEMAEHILSVVTVYYRSATAPPAVSNPARNIALLLGVHLIEELSEGAAGLQAGLRILEFIASSELSALGDATQPDDELAEIQHLLESARERAYLLNQGAGTAAEPIEDDDSEDELATARTLLARLAQAANNPPPPTSPIADSNQPVPADAPTAEHIHRWLEEFEDILPTVTQYAALLSRADVSTLWTASLGVVYNAVAYLPLLDRSFDACIDIVQAIKHAVVETSPAVDKQMVSQMNEVHNAICDKLRMRNRATSFASPNSVPPTAASPSPKTQRRRKKKTTAGATAAAAADEPSEAVNALAVEPAVLNDIGEAARKVYQSLLPDDQTVRRRELLRRRLEQLIRRGRTWYNCAVVPYGSSASELAGLQSDIDLCVVTDRSRNSTNDEISDRNAKRRLLYDLTAWLRRNAAAEKYENIIPIATARVPIIKLRDGVYGIEVDICIDNTLALHNTELLRCYCRLDPATVRPMIYLVKRWAKARGINNPSGGSLSSYAYTIMVLHYLQQKGRLPYLQDEVIDGYALPPEQHRKEGRVDVSFHRDIGAVLKRTKWGALLGQQQTNEGFAQLLVGFFHYYATFDIQKYVVSIKRPTTSSASDEVAPLQTKEERWGRVRNGWRISIDDPFELERDLGDVIRTKKVMNKIINEFQKAIRLLQTKGNVFALCGFTN